MYFWQIENLPHVKFWKRKNSRDLRPFGSLRVTNFEHLRCRAFTKP